MAETIKFKNGEQLIGQWKQVQEGNLTFTSESLGEVTVALDKLQSFEPSKPVVVVTKSGQEVREQLSRLDSGSWEVTGGNTKQTLVAASVDGIYPEETYKPPEVKRQPWQSWKGNTSLGYGLQRGDQGHQQFECRDKCHAQTARPARSPGTLAHKLPPQYAFHVDSNQRRQNQFE